VTITSGNRARRLATKNPFEAPELILLIRMTYQSMRGRVALTPGMLSERELDASWTVMARGRVNNVDEDGGT